MRVEAPAQRTVCQLTGDIAGRPSKFFQALTAADRRAVDVDLIWAAFTAAVGFYDCRCGSAFQFDVDSTIEDYAALNRWLGHHVGQCPDRTTSGADTPAAEVGPDPADTPPAAGSGHHPTE